MGDALELGDGLIEMSEFLEPKAATEVRLGNMDGQSRVCDVVRDPLENGIERHERILRASQGAERRPLIDERVADAGDDRRLRPRLEPAQDILVRGERVFGAIGAEQSRALVDQRCGD